MKPRKSKGSGTSRIPDVEPEAPALIKHIIWFIRAWRRHWKYMIIAAFVVLAVWLFKALDIAEILLHPDTRIIDVKDIP
jgi:hypothetical protein